MHVVRHARWTLAGGRHSEAILSGLETIITGANIELLEIYVDFIGENYDMIGTTVKPLEGIF